MGGQSNQRNQFVDVIPLGSPSTDAALIAASYRYFEKRAVIESARLINGANVNESAGVDYLAVNLKNGSDVVASLSNLPSPIGQGALAAGVPKEMVLDTTKTLIPAGSVLTAEYDETEVGVAEVTEIQCVADVSDSLDQTSFLFHDEVGSVAFWFDTDDSGSTIPTDANAADRAVEITTIATDDDAETVASKVAVAINADSKFSASVDPQDATKVIVVSSTVGNKTDASDGVDDEATGFTFTVLTQGAAVVTQALTSAVLVLRGYRL